MVSNIDVDVVNSLKPWKNVCQMSIGNA